MSSVLSSFSCSLLVVIQSFRSVMQPRVREIIPWHAIASQPSSSPAWPLTTQDPLCCAIDTMSDERSSACWLEHAYQAWHGVKRSADKRMARSVWP
ncbi:hypothetical protein ACOMHN_029903 [Nucella lapillus]